MRLFLLLLCVLIVILLTPGCLGLTKTELTPGESLVERQEDTISPKEETTKRVKVSIYPPDISKKGSGEKVTLIICGEELEVLEHTVVEVETEETRKVAGNIKKVTSKATATGSGLSSRSDSVDLTGFKTSPPDVDISNGASASGGGLEYTMKGFKKNSGPFILYGIGGIAIVAGMVVAVLFKKILLGIGIAGSGVAVIAVATLFIEYPWVVLIAAAIALAVGVYFVISVWKGKRIQDTLKTIVKGIEGAPEEESKKVKENIQSEAEKAAIAKTVKAEVSKIKSAT